MECIPNPMDGTDTKMLEHRMAGTNTKILDHAMAGKAISIAEEHDKLKYQDFSHSYPMQTHRENPTVATTYKTPRQR